LPAIVTESLRWVAVPEPLTGATVARAAGKALGRNSALSDEVARLLHLLLGPSFDVIGQAGGRWWEYHLRNVGRIARKARRKAGDRAREGEANARAVYSVLEDGSLCDDELMAEYFGGMLAASITPGGRDDRAASWSRVVGSLSWLQVRAHFLLYREWADRLQGRTINLGTDLGRQQAQMDLDLTEFLPVLTTGAEIEQASALHNAVVGLQVRGLIEWFVMGSKSVDPTREPATSPYQDTLRVRPSIQGLELYGWAQGAQGLRPDQFSTQAIVFPTDPEIPRLARVTLPSLPAEMA
jgi:hypothetical protein